MTTMDGSRPMPVDIKRTDTGFEVYDTKTNASYGHFSELRTALVVKSFTIKNEALANILKIERKAT